MNMNQELSKRLSRIEEPNRTIEAEAARHLLCLTKPPGSLGTLEEIAVRLAGIFGEIKPVIGRKDVVVMCGDHGVVEEGVSAFPQEVTGLMMHNFANGKAAINVLARYTGANVTVVDVGSKAAQIPDAVLSRKVKSGTANMAKGPAMTVDEAQKAILVGAEVAESLVAQGSSVIILGEMGIGNTTPSAAVTAVLAAGGVPAGLIGAGTGVDEEGLTRKEQAVVTAIRTNQPNPDDPLDTLAKVGGLEIAGLAGVVIGAAENKCPVIIDGVIAGAAALIAARMNAIVKQYLFASHLSVEPAHAVILRELGLTPMLHLNLRLGEGTGGALALPLMEAACRIVHEMATFADLGLPKPV